MASTPNSHPRRRGVRATSPQMTPLNTYSLAGLRKAGTFHSPASVNSDLCDPIVNYTFTPKRSSTSSEDLEELLNDAGVRRVAGILERFDRTFAGETPSSPEASILADPDVLAVPSGFVSNPSGSDSDDMDVDPKQSPIDHHHRSDSGLGSSVGSDQNASRRSGVSSRRSVASGVSAITKSFSALGARDSGHCLGKNAVRHIEDRIVKPILAERALKDFHPLIADVPRRIGTKDITNLRDLEKTLIFLAPDYSSSPALYLNFCERSIQCIHTTVEYLCERDQRLPTDRPYTNNYFLDLVEQIRRYASIMAASRQKQENGEELDEMDFTPGEKVALRGGLSENGRPLELVREKEGKTIPIADGDMAEPSVTRAFNSTKRSHEDEDEIDEDGVLRSMARRRKSDKPGDVIHACSHCDKEFKRPCDLTKHQKTHSRPFKCPDAKCKYHELGWPTEKERDRHYMDKHSEAPPQYPCLYDGCSYISKRESNCKQHMEKTHGYTYVRSKSNGRNKKPEGSTNQSPTTSGTPFNGTPASALQTLPTPETPFQASPSVPQFNFDNFQFPVQPVGDMNTFRRDSTTTAGTAMTYSSGFSPQQAVDHNFESAISPEEPLVNHDILFDPFNNPFTTAGLQQPTPALSTGYDSFTANTSHHATPNSNLVNNIDMPHLSPSAQPDVMFGNNIGNNQMDEGLGFDVDSFGHTTGDTLLFDNNASNSTNFDLFNAQAEFGGMGSHFEADNFNFNFDAATNFEEMMRQ